MKQSNFLSLNWADFGKGLLTAVLSFLAYYAQETIIPNSGLSEDLKIGISALIGYIIKNFFTPAETQKE